MNEKNISLGSKPDSADRVFTSWESTNRSVVFTHMLREQLEVLRTSRGVVDKGAIRPENPWKQPLVVVRGATTHVIDLEAKDSFEEFTYLLEEKTSETRSYCKMFHVYILPDGTVDPSSYVSVYDGESISQGEVVSVGSAISVREHDMLLDIEHDLVQFTLYQAEEVLRNLKGCVDALPRLS